MPMGITPVMQHPPLWGQPPQLSQQAGFGLPALINQLGTQTHIGLNGIVQFNLPLVQQIAAHKEQALPELYRFLSTTPSIPALIEGIYTAEQMTEAGVQNVASLYPAVSRWNTNPDPLVQIYLAGLYRELNIPTTFGPMLSTLVNRSVDQYPLQSSSAYNITEEVGGTLLQQIADTTADETVKRLLPYLSYPGVQQQAPVRFAARASQKSWDSDQLQQGRPNEVTLPDGQKVTHVSENKGSNAGGFYATADGSQTYFLKFPSSVGQVDAEIVTAKLAQKMGLTTKTYMAFRNPLSKHVAVGDPYREITQLGRQGIQDAAVDDRETLVTHLLHAAWTRNWDVVGLTYDNMTLDQDKRLMVVDYGGSLLWRAQGKRKADGMPKEVGELATLRDAGNEQAYNIFGTVTDAEIASVIAKKLAPVSPREIRKTVRAAHFSKTDRSAIETGLLARRQYLLDWAKAKKAV